jgi:hypothetical protein
MRKETICPRCGDKLSVLKRLKLLDESENKSVFKLTASERNQLCALKESDKEEGVIKSFSFYIHPKTLNKLNPNLSQHIVFIDSRRNDIYEKIRDYLLENKRNVSTFYSGGDADFICNFTGNRTRF